MFNVIYIELYKIFHKKNLYIFLGIILILSLLLSKASQSDVSATAISIPTALLQVLTMFIMPLFVSIMVAEIITGEYRSGTFKILLTRPISRVQLFFSKLITIFLFIAILYGFTLIMSYLTGGIFLGFIKTTQPVVTGKSIILEYLTTIEIYFLSIFPMFAFSCLVSLIALFFHKEGGLIAISIFLLYLFQIFALLLVKARPYLITPYFTITETLIKSPTTTLSAVLLGWGVVLLYIAIPGLVGALLFNQKDIAG